MRQIDRTLKFALCAVSILAALVFTSRCHGRCDKDDALDMHSVARPEQPRSSR